MEARRTLYGGQLPPLRRRLQELRRPARQRRSRRHEPRRQGGGRHQREEWGPCPLRERWRPRGARRYALTVNPYDIDEQADAIFAALSMPEEERGRRAKALREAVHSNTIEDWVEAQIQDIEAYRGRR